MIRAVAAPRTRKISPPPDKTNGSPDRPLLPALREMHAVGRDPDGRTLPHDFDIQIAAVVAQLAANGATPDEISRLLNLRPGTLRKHYRYELENGCLHANMTVATSLFAAARVPGNIRAAEIWLKARAGWRETDDKNANQSPLNIHIHA